MRPALGLVLLLLAPAALAAGPVGGRAPPPVDDGYAGGAVVVPLYCHIYDLTNAVPMNTQPMIDLDLARGFGLPTLTPVPQLDTPHSMRFYGSPGLVEYNVTEDGLPRYHPERGVSYDVLLDPATSIVGHWFMSVKATDVPQAGRTDGPEAGVMPQFTVRMTMRVGDRIGADLDSGELIAQGQTTIPPEAWAVNGAPVEVVVDMGKPLLDRIPGNDSYNVKVEWFNAEANGERATQRDWILHTGARYPNRIEVGVLNPLALYAVRPTPVGDDLLTIHATLNSPFGNYDVDAASLEIQVDGPSRPSKLSGPLVVQRNFEHNAHYAPVEATWSWPFREDGAPPGDYTVRVTAKNLQGSATVTKTASFTIPEAGRPVGRSDAGDVILASGPEAPAETPLSAGLLVAAGLVAALATRRRGPA